MGGLSNKERCRHESPARRAAHCWSVCAVRLAPNFFLQEFTRSSAAAEIGVHNSPPPEVLPRLHYVALWLQQLRDELGEPVIVSSGYRSSEVNEAVGGSPSSDHLTGLAADFYCPHRSAAEVYRIIQALPWAHYDQLILYPGHVHVGLGAPMRGQAWRQA